MPYSPVSWEYSRRLQDYHFVMNGENTSSRVPPAPFAYPLGDACGHDHKGKVVYLFPGFSTNERRYRRGKWSIVALDGNMEDSLRHSTRVFSFCFYYILWLGFRTLQTQLALCRLIVNRVVTQEPRCLLKRLHRLVHFLRTNRMRRTYYHIFFK